MKYRVAMDSAGEIPPAMKGCEEVVPVPFTLIINGISLVDDGRLSQKEILELIAKDPDVAKTACPSPQSFYDAFDGSAEHNYALTISAELSGSYQSACVARSMFLEDHPDAKVHVFNSISTSCGQTLALLKIAELEAKGLPFEEIVEQTEGYIHRKCTFFVLDNLETLRKNGRLSGMKALAAAVLKIKPVCYGTENGTIAQIDQARGINKAIVKLVQHVVERTVDPENLVLGISHCNCPDRAEIVKAALLERMKVKDVFVQPTGGLSSVYANDGGIIVCI